VPLSPVTSCVLDGEVVAVEPATGALLPFQVLSTRARKDVTLETVKVPVVYVAFDCLFLNGVSLLGRPLGERRRILRAALREVPGKFAFARSAESTDTEEIGVFLGDSVRGGCEGLMVKLLEGADSEYVPSKRSLSWLKLKKDYMDGLADSLDLVPVAAWLGKGKRAGVFGAYLLAAYDAEAEEYQSVCKVGTGFSEDALGALTEAFKAKGCIVARKPGNVLAGDAFDDADAWFEPEGSEVWEVRAADLSISPVHKAGVGVVDDAKGIGLRFPRFIRRRDDKSPADATSADQVAQMYRAQSTTKAASKEDDWDD
jgi:DNA ligase-1